MPSLVAALIVFGASAAILVLEILAVRLLAPFVGITLETTTAVIGLPMPSARSRSSRPPDTVSVESTATSSRSPSTR